MVPLTSITTFDDPALLRAASLRTAMHCVGAMFAESTGSLSTYETSREVARIDVFISHNWSVHRILKFLVLAIHFNGSMAFFASFGSVVVLSACIAVRSIPLEGCSESSHSGLGGSCNLIGLGVLASSVLTFFLVFLFAHEFQETITCRNQKLFLDKCCINQDDLELKQQGISKLPAFVFRSSSMLICYTNVYLKKLWTVYEVASFLMVHPVTGMHVRPTLFPLIILCGIIVRCLPYMNISLLSGSNSVLLWWLVIFPSLSFGCVAFTALLRAWAKLLVNINHSASEFDVKDALCFDERDRAIVEKTIVTFMRRYKHVGNDVDFDETLEAFNNLVRHEVPTALLVSIGRTGIPYTYAAFLGLPKFSFLLTRTAISYLLGQHRLVCIRLVYTVTCFTYGPLTFAFLLSVAKRFGGLRGCKEVAYQAWLLVLYLVLYVFYDDFDWNVLALGALDSDLHLMIFIAYSVALVFLTAVVFRPLKFRASASFLHCSHRVLEPSSQLPPREVVGICAQSSDDVVKQEGLAPQVEKIDECL